MKLDNRFLATAATLPLLAAAVSCDRKSELSFANDPTLAPERITFASAAGSGSPIIEKGVRYAFTADVKPGNSSHYVPDIQYGNMEVVLTELQSGSTNQIHAFYGVQNADEKTFGVSSNWIKSFNGPALVTAVLPTGKDTVWHVEGILPIGSDPLPQRK